MSNIAKAWRKLQETAKIWKKLQEITKDRIIQDDMDKLDITPLSQNPTLLLEALDGYKVEEEGIH